MKAKSEYPFQAIFERDNFTCRYCGWDGSSDFDNWWVAAFNVDHIIPKSQGGTDAQDNLVLACRACNQYKGNGKCNSLDDAIKLVHARRERARRWFGKHVLKLKE